MEAPEVPEQPKEESIAVVGAEGEDAIEILAKTEKELSLWVINKQHVVSAFDLKSLKEMLKKPIIHLDTWTGNVLYVEEPIDAVISEPRLPVEHLSK